MSRPRQIFYHITSRENADRIFEDNRIVPYYSTGKRARSWYCTEEFVVWGIAHVAARHNWRVEDMIVVAVRSHPRMMKKYGPKNLYWSNIARKPYKRYSALKWLMLAGVAGRRLNDALDGGDWYEHLRQTG